MGALTTKGGKVNVKKCKIIMLFMVNAQEWLEIQEEYNTKEKRELVKKLYISNRRLEGKLDLLDFVNLEGLDCTCNNLTSINIIWVFIQNFIFQLNFGKYLQHEYIIRIISI